MSVSALTWVRLFEGDKESELACVCEAGQGQLQNDSAMEEIRNSQNG